MGSRTSDYNIPSNNRELQLPEDGFFSDYYYNIPSNNRELQRVLEDFIKRSIITYQVITGNYSAEVVVARSEHIITYQVITGNYSIVMKYKSHEVL